MGLDAALYQHQNGNKRVIAYVSRRQNKAEGHFYAHKLEFLALKWSVCEKFNEYLYGAEFKVLIDNNPLTYTLTSAKPDATGHRWPITLYRILTQMPCYDFQVLWRLQSQHKVDKDSIEAICNAANCQPYVESLCCSVDILEKLQDLNTDGTLRNFNAFDLRQLQASDHG